MSQRAKHANVQMCQCTPNVSMCTKCIVRQTCQRANVQCVNIHQMCQCTPNGQCANVPTCHEPMCQSANVPMCPRANVPMCQRANVPMCQHANMQCANLPMCQCANMQCANLPMCQHAHAPMCQSANVSMCNIRWANMTVLMHRNTHIRATSRCACTRRAALRP
jgi:hypothetical protein